MPTIAGTIVSTGSQAASGRRSFLEVIDELARPIDADDSTVRALAGDAFRSAVRTVNRRGLWPWEAMDEDITLTANNAFSTLTSAVKKPLAMHYLNAQGGTINASIGYTPYPTFLEKYTADVSGRPHTYTLPNLFETGQVRWFPAPSSTYYARFSFYRVTPIPRTDSETIEVPEYALELYMAYAWVEFLKRLPSQQRPFDIQIAMMEANSTFRQMAHHVASPGDRTREV